MSLIKNKVTGQNPGRETPGYLFYSNKTMQLSFEPLCPKQGQSRGAEKSDPADAERRQVPVPAHGHHPLRHARRRPHPQKAAPHLLGDRAQAHGRRQAHARNDPRV